MQHDPLIRDIGDEDIDTVKLELLREHLHQHKHLKPSSPGHKIRGINGLFNWLVEDEILLHNPR